VSRSIYTKHGEDIENGKGIKRTKSALDAQTSNIEHPTFNIQRRMGTRVTRPSDWN
jgi:hypothetical protein